MRRSTGAGGDYISLYYEFPYVQNVLESAIIAAPQIAFGLPGWRVNTGFHSYSPDICLIVWPHAKHIEIETEEGTWVTCMWLNPLAVVVKCIIPKGSKYFLNERGEYVSNKIIATSEYASLGSAFLHQKKISTIIENK